MPQLDVSTLTGHHVVLEPLRADHVDAIAAAGAGDRSTFEWTGVPDGHDDAAAYVEGLLHDAQHARIAPFVQVRAADGVAVGCTRLMNPLWWLGRDDPDEVEIGGTWLAADAQRTPINTEAKLLLLTHAFDRWGVQRVAICTDARNERSRRAIERIGGTFEGILRRHRVSAAADGRDRLRDTAAYSIVVDDWPPIRERLTALTRTRPSRPTDASRLAP